MSSYVSNHLNPNSISNNNINLIFTDSNEKIWIGTENGLNEVIIPTSYENKRENYSELLKNLNLKHYKVGDGLSGNSVKSILEDDQKRLWISTENGISVLDLETKKFINWVLMKAFKKVALLLILAQDLKTAHCILEVIVVSFFRPIK
ncbi:MAG: hypothetical protein CM15mP32_4500 [Flavobacteriaceae bacterium]|nr:MAG: hypothetical protein CM15mP32_4500 [Flavobacteriaceae bacterium]